MYQNQYYPYQYNQSFVTAWVHGKEGANAFPLMPGTNAILMDIEEEGKMYIKMCNQVGVCTLKDYEYKEVMEKSKDDYITRSEFLKAIEELKGAMNEQSVSAT